MSTRSVIIITGKTHNYSNEPFTVRLYKHSDGYPSANLDLIVDALEQTKKVAKEYADRFENDLVYPVSLAVGKVIGASTSFYGIGAIVEEEFEESFEPSHLGNHADLEWQYVIDLEKKDVSVFKCNGNPQASYKKGVSDPLPQARIVVDVSRVIKEAKDKISKAIGRIVKLGFSFNGKKEKKEKKEKKKTVQSEKTKKLNALKRKKDEKSKSPKATKATKATKSTRK